MKTRLIELFLVVIMAATGGAWVASVYWADNAPPYLDPREAYCRGYIEGRTQHMPTPEDEEFCMTSIKNGLNFEEIGLKGPLAPSAP